MFIVIISLCVTALNGSLSIMLSHVTSNYIRACSYCPSNDLLSRRSTGVKKGRVQTPRLSKKGGKEISGWDYFKLDKNVEYADTDLEILTAPINLWL